jgi:peptidoglycan hydrolase-like amidase
MKRVFIFVFLLALLLPVSNTQRAIAQKPYLITETPYPKIIRVAVRENNISGTSDPRGRIIYVMNVNFDQYIRDVLPNEWMPSWRLESLKAGALAVKMSAWYHHLHPVKISGYTFDVDNTVNFQIYRENTHQPITDAAFNSIDRLAFVERNGNIFELNYRAGYQNNPNWQYRNAQKMSQWGSQYWAERGRSYLQILQFYYEGRQLVQIPGR